MPTNEDIMAEMIENDRQMRRRRSFTSAGHNAFQKFQEERKLLVAGELIEDAFHAGYNTALDEGRSGRNPFDGRLGKTVTKSIKLELE